VKVAKTELTVMPYHYCPLAQEDFDFEAAIPEVSYNPFGFDLLNLLLLMPFFSLLFQFNFNYS
jgi:hypothetical protein